MIVFVTLTMQDAARTMDPVVPEARLAVFGVARFALAIALRSAMLGLDT